MRGDITGYSPDISDTYQPMLNRRLLMEWKNFKNNNADVLMNRKEAASYLKFSHNSLAQWASNGRYDLQPRRIGRRVFYLKSVLDKFLHETLKP